MMIRRRKEGTKDTRVESQIKMGIILFFRF